MTNAPPEELVRSGYGHLARDDYSAAAAIADRLLRDFEATAAILVFAGETRFRREDYAGAKVIAERCASEFPEDIAGGILHCRALLALGQLREARDRAVVLAGRDVTDDKQVGSLVTILSGCLAPDAAYPIAKAAAERDPSNPAAQRRLAVLCQALGKIDVGYEAASRVIRQDPHDYDMIGLRSTLKTATDSANHIDELEALLTAGCRTQIGAARTAYALAKELEDVGQRERSFAVLDAAATFKKQTLSYSLQRDLDMIRMLLQHYTEASVSGASTGYATREPIFILGLPRTGSSLLERVLSSHSALFSAGELLHFEAELMIGIHKLGATSDPEEIVSKSVLLDPEALGRSYIERTRSHTGHTKHFIDKRPLNFLWLGAIRRALPDATVLHVRRTPLDACYAIYKFLFEDTYPWSYDLNEIAYYYIGYRKLMDHWRNIMPGYVVDVAYEDLVADLECTARAMLERLGLDWQPEVLDFHANEQAALTGSAVQVRRKIYASSVGRWRDHEQKLKPVADILERAGIDPYYP